VKLENYSIEDANVSGIGAALTKRLQQLGIKTAADVEYRRIRIIYGIGSTRAANLVAWRHICEAEVRRQIMQSPPPAIETQIQTIQSHYQTRRTLLNQQERQTRQTIIQKKEEIRARYETQRDHLAALFEAMEERFEKAHLDLEDKISQQVKSQFDLESSLLTTRRAFEAYQRINPREYGRHILRFWKR
jgi:DNA-binding helix-hairpin-helix protein with protein kinase domain